MRQKRKNPKQKKSPIPRKEQVISDYRSSQGKQYFLEAQRGIKGHETMRLKAVEAKRCAREANDRLKYHALRLQELSIYQKKSSEI